MSGTTQSLAELLARIQGRTVGGSFEPSSVRIVPPAEAGPGTVTFLDSARHLRELSSPAGVLVVRSGLEGRLAEFDCTALVVVDDAYVALARAAAAIDSEPAPPPGVDPTARVDGTARLGPDVRLGPYVVVGPRVVVGEGTILEAGVHVREGASVGAYAHLHDRVVIGAGCRVGDRCVLHPGVVVGADGFGFARPERGPPLKLPQWGTVEIGDDVEIGANSCIDRGTFGPTRVGRGTKIDNLVQVGHNAQVGEECVLVAQSGVAGSARLESGAIVAAQAGVAGHRRVGHRGIASAQAGVMRDVPDHTMVVGSPAEPRWRYFRRLAYLRRLEELFRRVRILERERISR